MKIPEMDYIIKRNIRRHEGKVEKTLDKDNPDTKGHHNLKKEEMKKKVKDWDMKCWKNELKKKSSLEIYREYMEFIGTVNYIYDNTPASVFLYKGRTNNLQLSDCKRFTNENTMCNMCRADTENIKHFIFHYLAYNTVHIMTVTLQ